MLDTHQNLDERAAAAEDYVQGTFGIALGLKPIAPKSLPNFILDRYRLWQGSLLGQPLLLVAGEGWKPGEGFTADFMRQRDLLRDRMHIPLVVLLLDHAPAAIRRQMVARRIAFLAPGSQFYIPEVLLDIRERTVRARAEPSGTISPTAQLLLLAALLGHQLRESSQTEIAARLKVSIMSVSRALDELEALEIAKGRQVGRQRRLHLLAEGGDLWATVKDKLHSPIRKLRSVHGTIDLKNAPLAGESALAHYTMLGEPRIEQRAIAAARWMEVAEHLEVGTAFEFADDRFELETWSYEPSTLARDGFVDPLSLYLSARYNLDERVAQAADQLLEPFGW
jgi:DNA-binding MarR family transcriptional regulator